jgi:spore coat polysaccharide biosynthesis predicted glycosyltransferase SpsG
MRCEAVFEDASFIDSPHPNPEDLRTLTANAHDLEDGVLVLDGYHFTPDYQEACKELVSSVLVVDDFVHHSHYIATVILNQNLHALNVDYPCDASTKVLLGPSYALLRDEFLHWTMGEREFSNRPPRILVTFGGGKFDQALEMALTAVGALVDAEVVVLKAQSTVSWAPSPNIRILERASSMPELMAWADIALAACGSTCWELAFMGLPSALLTLSEDQDGNGASLEAAGVAVYLGQFGAISAEQVAESVASLARDPDRRREMSHRGHALVDGRGADRVVTALAQVRG